MKKTTALLSYMALAIILICSACKKNTNATTSETVDDTTTVISTITGVVLDEKGNPMMDATVTLGTNNTITDALGLFEFTNISMSQNNAYLKVNKTGYFTGHRSLRTAANGSQYTEIKLAPRTLTGTVVAASGGVVTTAGGNKVTFSANSFVDQSGTPYAGNVNVYMHVIGPTATDLSQIMVGDLRGITTNNQERALTTYGMLGVELTGSSGQTLKLASGKTAEIRMPIPSALQSGAPATIPLWHFNETKGRWIEEGSVNKIGNEFVGNVSHFSFWNIDVPGNSNIYFIDLILKDNLGNPIPNLSVEVQGPSNASLYNGFSNSNGIATGMMSQGITGNLIIRNRCGAVIHTSLIGPYYSNTQQQITVNSTVSKTVISGVVYNCGTATPVNTGLVRVYATGGAVYDCYIQSGGTFSATIYNCAGASGNVKYSMQYCTNTLATAMRGTPKGISLPATGAVSTGHQLENCNNNSTRYVHVVANGVPDVYVFGVDSFGTTPQTPTLSANKLLVNVARMGAAAGVNPAFEFSLNFNNTLGIYPLGYWKYTDNQTYNSNANNNSASNGNIVFTQVGPSGGFLTGSFSTNGIGTIFSNMSITPVNIYCNFNTRRQ